MRKTSPNIVGIDEGARETGSCVGTAPLSYSTVQYGTSEKKIFYLTEMPKKLNRTLINRRQIKTLEFMNLLYIKR